MADILLNTILFLVLFDYLAGFFLDYINFKNWPMKLTDKVRLFYDLDRYVKAFRYNKDHYFLGLLEKGLSVVMITAFLLFGGFNQLDIFVRSIADSEFSVTLLFFGILYLGHDILFFPFQYYSTFVIEENYGFNRTRFALYISDKLKSYILIALLGSFFIAVMMFLYGMFQSQAWIFVWGVFTAVMIFFQIYYTTLIVPIFNKLTPLAPGKLRNEIEKFAEKVNFPLDNIYVMDGSKRSAKANAFFSGVGKKKKIVLYDTLIEKHTTDELVSVLAHEVGHYKKKHVYQGMAFSIFSSAVMLFLLFWFAGNPYASSAVGIQNPGFHGSLLAFGILFGPLSFLLGMAGNILSRKNEYEADDFAVKNSGQASLSSALKKLNIMHLANVTPHPLYVFFHYSHPPLISRLENIQRR